MGVEATKAEADKYEHHPKIFQCCLEMGISKQQNSELLSLCTHTKNCRGDQMSSN